MLTADLLLVLDGLAPAGLAEEWDNVGLMVGRRDREITRVLVALDLRTGVLDEALATGSDAILLHHPPIFPALPAVSDATVMGSLVLRAAEVGVTVIAAHTNLDSARGGLNDLVAQILGIHHPVPIVPSASDCTVGLGRVGEVEPQSLGDLTARAAEAFLPRRTPVTVAGDPDAPIHRVAVCTGSGGSLIAAARAAGADAYVTGDLTYHDFDTAEGMGLVNVPHGAVERHALSAWIPVLAAVIAPSGVTVGFAAVDTDPWYAAC